jgi:hypothetical protein
VSKLRNAAIDAIELVTDYDDLNRIRVWLESRTMQAADPEKRGMCIRCQLQTPPKQEEFGDLLCLDPSKR